MEDYSGSLLYSILSLLFLIFSLKFLIFSKSRKPKPNLPPSPPGWLPVIGHLRLLKRPIHRNLCILSAGAGSSVISLRLGSRLAYVVSSYSVAADECFTKNDVVLANRPQILIGKYIGYNNTNLVAAAYGDHWRNLRRICAIEIFSGHRLNSFLPVRIDEVRRLILRLSRAVGSEKAVVEIRPMMVDLTFNSIMRMLTGKRYYGEEEAVEDEAERESVRQLLAEVGAKTNSGNAVEYLPMLRWFSNYEKKMKNLGKRTDEFLQNLVDEKRRQMERGNTLIDYLLCLQDKDPQYYTDRIIKGLILVMIIAGTNTSAVTLEWALSNLLNHPRVITKARTEIDNQIGLDRLIDESDLPKLTYLQSILNETLRLHPAAPLLVPHMASEDCKLGPYDMPRGTTLLINAWAIHRDPALWEDPDSFKPERFEKEGQSAKLMPFGLGRRACPGSGLAQRVIGLTLGSMIQCFEWEREGDEEVDMKEGIGNTVPRETPLKAVCKARPLVMDKFFPKAS